MKKFQDLKHGQVFMRAGKKPGTMISTIFVKVTHNTYRKECRTQKGKADTAKYPFLDIDPDENVYPM